MEFFLQKTSHFGKNNMCRRITIHALHDHYCRQ
jgi:hypothetical protein